MANIFAPAKTAENNDVAASDREYCAYSHFSAMLDRTGLDWALAMFEFELYCDDSGTDGNSVIAAAACYVSSKRQWDEFIRNWDQVAKDEGFPYFHMTNFMAKAEAGHKPYCDWDNTKKSRVYGKLASIINTRARQGFGIAIPKAAFDAAAPKHFRDHYARDHYTYAVMCCLGMVADWRAKYKIVPPIQYVFDQGSPQDQISAVWKLIADDPHYAQKFGLAPHGCGFQDKKVFKPLQAADILAWQMRNHVTRLLDKYKLLSSVSSADEVNMCPNGFKLLRNGRPMRLGFYSEDQMRKVFTDAEEYEKQNGKPPYLSLFIPKLV